MTAQPGGTASNDQGALAPEPPLLLDVRDLHVEFAGRGRSGVPVRAANGVSLRLAAGETLGLVGESGSGKSTIGNAILGLVQPSAGSIRLLGQEVTHATPALRRELGRHVRVVFQDPYNSLNPSRSIGSAVAAPLIAGGRHTRAEITARISDVLTRVGLSPDAASRYPAQFSGGQRQRIAIARAVIGEPRLIICDEPTSALDLSVQAQVINLLLDLQRQLRLAFLFISHDIDVVRHMSHRVAVLLRGHIVESGPAELVTGSPGHPYTQALLLAAPVPDPRQQACRRRDRVPAAARPAMVGPLDNQHGCPFAKRCPSVMDVCTTTMPALRVLPTGEVVACHL